MAEQPDLLVADAAAWRDWLAAHGTTSDGVWLRLAKKGTTEPTTLTYDQALDEALCQGWIDGQVRKAEDGMFKQRWTPRRARSIWSQRNVALVERLAAEGRMQPAGQFQIERAQADGRWAAAYAGAAAIEVPPDLAAALRGSPDAREMFGRLNAQNRYAVLHRVTSVVRPETRTKRIATYVNMLERGETIYPQTPPGG